MTTKTSVTKTRGAVIVTRVSTNEQVKHGTSLDSQSASCRAKAAALGLPVVAEFEDAGKSGAFLLQREGMRAALALIKDGKADTLITATIDRLSRNEEHQQRIRREVENAGGHLIFCDMDLSDPFTFAIMGAVAAKERRRLRERTTEGKLAKAAQGEQPSRRTPPFGYHIVVRDDIVRGTYTSDHLGRYVVLEHQAPFAREIFTRYMGGASLRGICAWLAEQGVPTPRHAPYWKAKTLAKILRNPVYKGKAAYCREQNHYDESRLEQGFRSHLFHLPRPEEEWVYVDAPALVDAQTWDACQKRLVENKTRLSGPSERKHMLSGLLRCPACGRNMIGHRQTRVEPRKRKETYIRHIHYYHCPEGRSLKLLGTHACSRKQYKAAVVEGLAERAVEQLAGTSEFVRCALENHRQRALGGYSEQEYAQATAQARALDGKEEATVRAQVAGIESGANPAIYTGLLKEIGEKRARLEAQLAQIEERRAAAASIRPQEEADVIRAAMRDVSEALRAPELTPAEKHALLAQVIKDIVPREEGFLLTLRPPFSSAATVTSMSASSLYGFGGCLSV